MRNLLLLILMASCGKPNTTCKNKLPDGYYVRYSTIRYKYAIYKVVCKISHNYDYTWDNDAIVTDTIVTYDTSWLRLGYNIYSFSSYHAIATFRDSCAAKKACISSLSVDDIITDFK
jgi:hypothetical protein